MDPQSTCGFLILDVVSSLWGVAPKESEMDKEMFKSNPRGYALELVENGMDAEQMLIAALVYMSHDDVRGFLDANELSPRFLDEEDED